MPNIAESSLIRKKTSKKGNQYMFDPRQGLFLQYYLDPKSETFSNAYQSAIKATYEEEYAKTITAQMPDWLAENIRKFNMLGKAERNLDKILDLETKEPVIGMFGKMIDPETKEVIMKENGNLLKTKADVSKFIAERIGKDKYATDPPVGDKTFNITQIIINGDTRDKSNGETNTSLESLK